MDKKNKTVEMGNRFFRGYNVIVTTILAVYYKVEHIVLFLYARMEYAVVALYEKMQEKICAFCVKTKECMLKKLVLLFGNRIQSLHK